MTNNSFTMQTLIHKVRSPKHKYLVANISLFAFAVQIAAIIVNKYLPINSEFVSLLVSGIGAVAFFGILGLAGLVVVIRQELPQFILVRGKLAVINGLVWCAISWVLMIRYSYLLIVDIVKFVSLANDI